MKKVVGMLMAAIMLCLLLGTAVFASELQGLAIQMEGKSIKGQAAVIENVVYLPLRPVSNELGFKVTWLGKEKKILLDKAGDTIEISLEDFRVSANEHKSYIGDIYRNVDGAAYLSKTFFEDVLGLKVVQTESGVLVQGVEKNPIIIKTIQEASETEELILDLQYPQIQGLANAQVQEELNSFFKAKAEDARSQGLRNAEDLREFRASGYGSPNKCGTYFDYAIKYNQKGILSVVFYDYQYSGGAHGLTVQSSAAFDLSTGKEYRLEDLFVEGTDHVSILSGEVIRLMKEEGIWDDLLSPFEAISPDQNFYFSNDSLVVYFQAYEYMPYAYGIPEFEIDYSVLQNNLKPEFKGL